MLRHTLLFAKKDPTALICCWVSFLGKESFQIHHFFLKLGVEQRAQLGIIHPDCPARYAGLGVVGGLPVMQQMPVKCLHTVSATADALVSTFEHLLDIALEVRRTAAVRLQKVQKFDQCGAQFFQISGLYFTLHGCPPCGSWYAAVRRISCPSP